MRLGRITARTILARTTVAMFWLAEARALCIHVMDGGASHGFGIPFSRMPAGDVAIFLCGGVALIASWVGWSILHLSLAQDPPGSERRSFAAVAYDEVAKFSMAVLVGPATLGLVLLAIGALVHPLPPTYEDLYGP